jgi:hypothetical protein
VTAKSQPCPSLPHPSDAVQNFARCNALQGIFLLGNLSRSATQEPLLGRDFTSARVARELGVRSDKQLLEMQSRFLSGPGRKTVSQEQTGRTAQQLLAGIGAGADPDEVASLFSPDVQFELPGEVGALPLDRT